jgi:hypothetical protein
MKKQTKLLVRVAIQQGWIVRRSTKHVQFLSPDGETIITAQANMKGGRAYANTLAQLRRAGLDFPRAMSFGQLVGGWLGLM